MLHFFQFPLAFQPMLNLLVTCIVSRKILGIKIREHLNKGSRTEQIKKPFIIDNTLSLQWRKIEPFQAPMTLVILYYATIHDLIHKSLLLNLRHQGIHLIYRFPWQANIHTSNVTINRQLAIKTTFKTARLITQIKAIDNSVRAKVENFPSNLG